MRARHVALAFLTTVGATFVQPSADAQTTAYVITFDSVSSYGSVPGANTLTNQAFVLTGVQHGASAPSTLSLEVYSTSSATGASAALVQSCEKQFIIAINRPGRFSLGLMTNSVSAPTGTAISVIGCTLTQLP